MDDAHGATARLLPSSGRPSTDPALLDALFACDPIQAGEVLLHFSNYLNDLTGRIQSSALRSVEAAAAFPLTHRVEERAMLMHLLSRLMESAVRADAAGEQAIDICCALLTGPIAQDPLYWHVMSSTAYAAYEQNYDKIFAAYATAHRLNPAIKATAVAPWDKYGKLTVATYIDTLCCTSSS